MPVTPEVRDEAAENRESAFIGLWALARALEDPRYQRPGMQRRREWAKQIDRCVKVLAENHVSDEVRGKIGNDALQAASKDLRAIAMIGETPRNEVSDLDWLRYCAHQIHDLPRATLTRVADWLTDHSKDDRR